ncbi:MAG: uL15 family ribosomal protein [DPANN group archaeon]|nr:uL15 family ribosomal protein [DPANN group archaeon]
MVIHRKKRSRKFRASRRHGFGFSKQHQGKGHRGGTGLRGGSGKRGQQRMTKFYSEGIHPLGRIGMRVHRVRDRLPAITTKDLDEHLERWTAEKKVTKSGDIYEVDLAKLGYSKLIKSGGLQHKIKLIGPSSASLKGAVGGK